MLRTSYVMFTTDLRFCCRQFATFCATSQASDLCADSTLHPMHSGVFELWVLSLPINPPCNKQPPDRNLDNITTLSLNRRQASNSPYCSKPSETLGITTPLALNRLISQARCGHLSLFLSFSLLSLSLSLSPSFSLSLRGLIGLSFCIYLSLCPSFPLSPSLPPSLPPSLSLYPPSSLILFMHSSQSLL